MDINNPIKKYINGKFVELPVDGENVSIKYLTRKNEYAIDSLVDKSPEEIKTLLERQKSLLNNKAFTNKLADRGEKLKHKYEELKQALEIVNNSKLINEEVKLPDADKLEWIGKMHNTSYRENHSSALDSDDDDGDDAETDDTNPLRIMATHSYDAPPVRKHKIKNSIEKKNISITEELERLEICDRKLLEKKLQKCDFNENVFKHVKETPVQKKKRESFKPYRPAKNTLHETGRKVPPSPHLWVESAATGPMPKVGPTTSDEVVLPFNVFGPILLVTDEEATDLLDKSLKAEREMKLSVIDHIGKHKSKPFKYVDVNEETHFLAKQLRNLANELE